ncbi:CBO0543 family protein (plasmid) [Priestia megaterium]|uniref:CBO0543 family protein n=1 Tax=Priestia megaterium TaxID=1404 RepID=UPI0035BE1DA3
MVAIFICFIIFNLLSFFVPKKLTPIEIYATSFFAYAYGMTTDMILDLHYNLYGYFQEGFQWLSLLAIIMYFPSISFLFLNFYPFTKSLGGKLGYILSWTIFSVVFEWFAVKTDFFYYNGWELLYSAIVYPFIFLVLLMNLKVVRKIITL